MESEDEEDINDEALKGSFLALKQLQVKGRKVAQIKKVSTQIQKLQPPPPRSSLYEEFKKINSLESSTSFIDLETKIPVSLLMYRTYEKIFADKYKKIRYAKENQPNHPFFGDRAVLAEEFKLSKTPENSAVDKSIELTKEAILRFDYNYFSLSDVNETDLPKTERPVVIKPLKTRKLNRKKSEGLDPELLANIQKVVVSSEDEN